MEYKDLVLYCSLIIVFKSFMIGSEFNFYYWYKYGKKYTKWYFNSNRTKFDPKIIG